MTTLTSSASTVRDRRIDVVIERALGGMAAMYLVWSLRWVEGAAALGPWWLAGSFATQAVLLLVAVRGLGARLGRLDLAVLPLGLLVGLALGSRLEGPVVGLESSPAFAVAILGGLSAALLVVNRWFWAYAGGIFALYVVGRHATGHGEWALDEAVSSLSVIAVVWYTIRLHRQARRRADDALRDRGAAAARESASTTRELAQAERRRVLHDEVIGALVAIGHTPSPDVAREAADRALAALAGTGTGTGTGTTVPAADEVSTALEVDVEPDAFALDLPAAVRTAVTGAAAEAVRNADRHAGALRIRVHAVARTDGGIEVEVTDDGTGFDPSVVGFGLRHSVHGRMRDIGGTAVIESTPGRGTAVRLTWSPHDAPPAIDEHGLFGRTATAFALTGQLVIMARHVEVPGQLVVAVAVLGVVLSAGWLADRGSLTDRTLPLLALATCGAMAAGLRAAGPGGIVDYRTWVLCVASVPIFAIALVVGFRRLVLFGAALSATVLAWVVHDPLVGPLDAGDAITQPLVYAVAFGALVLRLRSSLHDAHRDEEQIVRTVEAETRTLERARVDAEQERAVHSLVVPFLEAVRSGEADPTERLVSERAHALAQTLRDELHLPGLVTQELRLLLAAARQRGSTITIHSSDVPPDGSPAADLLTAVVDPSVTQAVTLSLAVAGSPYARVVVRPPVEGETRRLADRTAARLGATVDHDEATVLTVPLD